MHVFLSILFLYSKFNQCLNYYLCRIRSKKMVIVIKKGTPKGEIKKRINDLISRSKGRDIMKYAGKLNLNIDPYPRPSNP